MFRISWYEGEGKKKNAFLFHGPKSFLWLRVSDIQAKYGSKAKILEWFCEYPQVHKPTQDASVQRGKSLWPPSDGGGEKPPKTRTSSTAYHPSPRYVTQSESQSLNTLFTAMICEALNFSIPEIFIETSTRLNIWLIMSTKIFEKQCHNRHALTVNPALISPRRIAKQTKGTKECETRSHLKSTRAWKGGNSAAGTQRSDTTERKLAETEKQTKRKQGHLITSFHIVTMSATALSICAIKSKLL